MRTYTSTPKTDCAGTARCPVCGTASKPARWAAVLIAVVSLFVSCKSAPPSETTGEDTVAEKDFSKEQRLEIYARAIKAEGYSLRILNGDIIEFRRGGLYYYVGVDDRD